MVQSKAPHKLVLPQAKTKKIQTTSEKQRHDPMDKARAESKKKKIAAPNYMKPTTCSDARKEKERVQVTLQSPTTADKSKTPLDSKSSSRSTAKSNTKPSKTLARKASLRPKRPSMKKSSGTALSPKRAVRRATCSSTLKDSKFPKVLDLNPGGKQTETTSVIRICPFDYCSLNGHKHKHLHPLNRLPSARRRVVKTQRSIRLKRLTSVAKRSFRKGRRNISSEKIITRRATQGSRITPVIEEVTDDFFVEIYAKPQEDDDVKHINCEERSNGQELEREISKILNNLESMEDVVECSEEETEEFDGTLRLIEIPEIYAQISFGDNLDQCSEISFDDLYAFDNNIPDSGGTAETLICFHENQGQWGYHCCGMNGVDNRDASLPDSEDNMSIEATRMDHEEEAESFVGVRIETCESSYGLGFLLDLSEGNDNVVDGFLFAPESALMTGHGGQIPEKGSTSLDYEEEATGSFAGIKIETSHSSNELGLDAQLPERSPVFSSDQAASLECNDDCSEHGEEGFIIKEQDICNLGASGKHNHRIQNPLADVLEQPDSLAETKLGDGLVIQGSGLPSSNEEISDLLKGNDQHSEILVFVLPKQHNDVSGTREMEASESIDLEGLNLAIANSIVAEATNDKVEDDNLIIVLGREKSEQVNLEESDLSTGNESPVSVNHGISVEGEETGDGQTEDSKTSSVERDKSEPNNREESELAVHNEDPDNINLSIGAEDAETGGDEDEENNTKSFESEKSEWDDLEVSNMATDDKCLDNVNLSIAREDEETGGGRAEENNIICFESKISEQDLEESELATDDEGPDNINLSSSEGQQSEPDVQEESELIGGDENPDNKKLGISKEDGIGNGKSKDGNMIEIEFSESHCENYDMHQNETVSDYIQPQVKIENYSSDDAMEDSSIQNEIPNSISIGLIEETNSEDSQMSEEEQLEDGGMSADDIFATNIISIENDITISTEETRCSQTPGVCNKQKARHIIINRRKNLDMEMLRLINPRAPRFLPVEPGPGDEEVDLRHQLMDERKSAEAWMIDFALQKVVKKLTPARKRKVALLIEAFEAVMPAPICESPLMSSTSGFRSSIQACI